MAARTEDLLCDFGGRRWTFLSHRPRTQSAFDFAALVWWWSYWSACEVGDVVVVVAAQSSSGSSFWPPIHPKAFAWYWISRAWATVFHKLQISTDQLKLYKVLLYSTWKTKQKLQQNLGSLSISYDYFFIIANISHVKCPILNLLHGFCSSKVVQAVSGRWSH